MTTCNPREVGSHLLGEAEQAAGNPSLQLGSTESRHSIPMLSECIWPWLSATGDVKGNILCSVWLKELPTLMDPTEGGQCTGWGSCHSHMLLDGTVKTMIDALTVGTSDAVCKLFYTVAFWIVLNCFLGGVKKKYIFLSSMDWGVNVSDQLNYPNKGDTTLTANGPSSSKTIQYNKNT